jgi:hypothetical protein
MSQIRAIQKTRGLSEDDLINDPLVPDFLRFPPAEGLRPADAGHCPVPTKLDIVGCTADA